MRDWLWQRPTIPIAPVKMQGLRRATARTHKLTCAACFVDLKRRYHEWSMPMWILMYVFSYSVSPAATNDRAEWRLLPTVVFQEFSNEERCRAAKSTLEGSLKEAGAKHR